jgi:hypothetical protein
MFSYKNEMFLFTIALQGPFTTKRLRETVVGNPVSSAESHRGRVIESRLLSRHLNGGTKKPSRAIYKKTSKDSLVCKELSNIYVNNNLKNCVFASNGGAYKMKYAAEIMSNFISKHTTKVINKVLNTARPISIVLRMIHNIKIYNFQFWILFKTGASFSETSTTQSISRRCKHP